MAVDAQKAAEAAAASTAEQGSDTYKTLMEVAWNFDYTNRIGKIG
ncbi:MAG: chemotaxis protein, partial [Gammaproteobacteria bacterium]|nr:chemotaxis protein [Gammaproteobacteria bacterium]